MKTKVKKQKVEAIDLFCGIGGLTYGLRKADIDVVAGLDNDASCRFSYEKNNNSKFILADISKYNFAEMKSLYTKDSIKVLVGCAPCQPFSSHSFKLKNKENKSQWNLINYFFRAVKVLKPHIISMENVRGITKEHIFKQFVKDINKLGYEVSYEIVNCADYGIPQGRNRLILLGSTLGKIKIPNRTHTKEDYVTVSSVIKSLPKLETGSINKKDPVHRTAKLSELNIKRIKQSKPSGSWKDWDKKLLPDCYKKKSGKTYTSVYGRMDWDNIAPTITTQFYSYGTGRFGHPKQHRALSIREGALLQTFPKGYHFQKNTPFTTMGRHIGNAVPPKLGKAIGQAIKDHLKDLNYVI